MQGLVVVRLIVEKIWNVNVNCVKVNGVQNIGQGHWVNISAKSGELRHKRTVQRQTDGRRDRRMEKRAPMSQSQEVREIFHTRFDGCLVL